MFNQEIRHLSDEALRGFYILFMLGIENKQIAVLTNGYLKKRFKVKKVSKQNLMALADQLKHLFECKISHDKYGRHVLELLLNNQPYANKKYFESMPDLRDIENKLGIQTFRISIEKNIVSATCNIIQVIVY